MPNVVLDFDPEQPDAPDLGLETADLVWFLSLAYAARFGASHELSQAAQVLQNDLALDVQPLLTFADREVEEEADAAILEHAWQEPARLAASCAAVAVALGADPRFKEVRAGYPHLQANIAALGRIAEWASTRGARIRVTYELEP
jgi:hypothetical protein